MSIFLELLQISLGNRDAFVAAPNIEQWESLFEEAQRQAVVGVLLDGLERLPDNQQPPKGVLLKWIGNEQLIEQQSKLNEDRTIQLARLFEDAGWKTCLLKGIGVAQLYPYPYKRQCGDVDLLVYGRRKDVMIWLRSKYVLHPPVWHNVAAEIFNDVPVEIHFHPSWSWNPFYNHRMQQWYERIWKEDGMTRENGYSVPAVEFQAVACLSHSYRHLIAEGIGLRHMIDYYYILRRMVKEDSDKVDEVVRAIERSGMKKYLGAMMWVLEKACGMPSNWMLCDPNEKEGVFLLNELMASGNFGHYRKGKPMPANSLKRYFVMAQHYPGEVIWMPAWKVWHRCWRFLNR